MNKKEKYLSDDNSVKYLSRIKKDILDNVVDYPDYPKPGILFKDIMPVFNNHDLLTKIADILINTAEDYDAIVAIESRGFILGAIISVLTNKPLILVRKKGKLPGECYSYEYDLEYGSAILETQKNAPIKPGMKVMIHDDILATGGTALAAGKLVEMFGATVSNYTFIATIDGLGGYDLLGKDKVIDLVTY
jgi:adenine phosphoribosyltransferase